MDPHDEANAAIEPADIRGRTDTGGAWSAAWPLVALALIGLMTVRACVPGLPSAAPASAPTTAPSGR